VDTLRPVAEGRDGADGRPQPASRHGGRHAAPKTVAHSGPGRPRRRGVRAPSHRWWLVLAAGLVVAIAVPVVGAATGPTTSHQPVCLTPRGVNVAVDPGVAGAVARLVSDTVTPALSCVRLAVSERPSAEVAAEISRRSGQGLGGGLPDVWVPDSRLWLAQARRTETGARRLHGAVTTVARTPVVVALPASRAAEAQWPADGPPIAALLGGAVGPVAVSDPTKDAAALATVLDVGAAEPTPTRAAAIADFARRVRVPGAGHVLDQVVAGQLGAVTTTERDVARHNAGAPATGQLAAYGGARPPYEEVTLVVVDADGRGRASAAVRAVAHRLRTALLASAGQAVLRGAGYRDLDGHLAARYRPAQPLSADRLPSWTSPSDGQVRGVVRSWSTLGRRGRVLVAVDSSGSMAGVLPGGAGTKSQLARSALSKVVSTIAPDSDMGLWTFTASRGRDYRVLVPLGPADGRVGDSTRRQALLDAIPQVRAVAFGGTGLYDTTLAAFRSASQDYAYGRLNAVMVITDGRNEDPGSVGLTGLLADLRREFDGIKPVRIITVAYGADADLGVLRRIADVTGGASYQAPTAADVAPLLAKALADL
jgi:hypothetical protein